MAKGEKIYGMCDKAWQPVVGCDPHMSCAPRCWARKTVARVVECQKPTNPDRAAFYQIALTPDGKQWSGKAYLDEQHLADPLKWHKPSLISTGFHGDWARLKGEDKDKIFVMMAMNPRHRFMTLTKQPQDIVPHFLNPADVRDRWFELLHDSRIWPGAWGDQRRAVLGNPSRAGVAEGILKGWRSLVLDNVTIGCSVMSQSEADKMLPSMRALSAMGWKTHVWYEPALGPVNWLGWGFLEALIVGGESGLNARGFDVRWGRDSLRWAQANNVAFWMKQIGSKPYGIHQNPNCTSMDDDQHVNYKISDRRGADMSDWSSDLRVREVPEWWKGIPA